MTKPSLQEEHRRMAQRPGREHIIHCAGCGAELPDTEAVVIDLLAANLRCDLCWRAMLAASATGLAPGGWWRAHELQPWLRAIARLIL